MGEMVMQTEARSFEISKPKSLLENPLNPPEVTRIGDPSILTWLKVEVF